MKSRQQVIFKRKKLQKLLEDVETYQFSEVEQERIRNDIKWCEWFLKDDIEPNRIITNI